MDPTPDHPAEPQSPTDPEPPVLHYAPVAPGNMRMLAMFQTEFEAHLAASLLEGQGLDCKVSTKLPVYALGPHGGALLVADADFDEAVKILANTPARNRLKVPASELPPARVLNVEVCPKCGSPDIGLVPRAHWILLAAAFLAWMPFVLPLGMFWYAGALGLVYALLYPGRPMECRACKAKWSQEDRRERGD